MTDDSTDWTWTQQNVSTLSQYAHGQPLDI